MRGSWRPNRAATYWPPLLWPSAFLSRSPGLLNRGPGAQPLWDMFLDPASSLQLVWSPTDLISNCNCFNRGPEGSLLVGAGFLYSILPPAGLVSKLTDFLSSPSYIIVQRRPSSCGRHNRTHSTRPQSKLYTDIPRADAPVIFTGAVPIWTARPGRMSICNTWTYGKQWKDTWTTQVRFQNRGDISDASTVFPHKELNEIRRKKSLDILKQNKNCLLFTYWTIYKKIRESLNRFSDFFSYGHFYW